MPDGDTRTLFLMYAVLGLSLGARVTRRDVHNAWTAWMLLRDDDHESLVPFDELDQDTRAEDDPFVVAIRDAASEPESG